MLLRHRFSNALRIHSIVRFKAFTLIELLILIAILLLLVCVLLPSLANQKRHARIRACVNNLKQVGVAFRIWPTDDRYPAEIELKYGGAKEQVQMGHAFFNYLVMSNELSTPKILVCPQDDGKAPATNFNFRFNDANISYFVGADAKDVFPQMFLNGDRNLAFENKPLPPGIFIWTSNRSALSWTKAIHNACGNVGLADGSVHYLKSRQLAEAAANQSYETNRLAIP